MNYKIDQSVFELFPWLESERLILRCLSDDDANDIYLIRSDDSIMKFMDMDKLTSVDEAARRIIFKNDMFAKKQGINWAIILKESNQLIGYFDFWKIIYEHCRAEIGYALKPEYWGKGYMSEAFRIILDFAFNKFCLHSIEANVNPGNKNSILLLEKHGFKKEAYFRQNYLYNGKYLDSFIFSLLEPDSRG